MSWGGGQFALVQIVRGGDTLHEGTLYTPTPVQLSTILSGAGIIRLIITMPMQVLRSSVQ